MQHESPLLAQHQRAGATIGTYFGCALPARFSTLEREYAFGREAAALCDTNYQTWAWLDGADRVRYLNAITTNNIKDLPAGHGVTGLLLNPQGHILAEITCFDCGPRLLLSFHALAGQRTLETLEKYIIMDDASLADVTAEFGSLAVEGPRAFDIVRDFSGVALADAAELAHFEKDVEGVTCRIIRRSRSGPPGAEILLERERVPFLWDYLASAVRARGGGRIGYDALHSLRLEAGMPWFSYDFDEHVIPHEAGLEHSHISYAKGCYTGQEIVERVRARGQVNRMRIALKFSSAEPPAPGAKLFAAEREAGRLTSAAFSPRLTCPIGFAYLRREYAAPGTQLTLSNGGAAEVIALPLRDL
jgi:folate-binding protein YgfZ